MRTVVALALTLVMVTGQFPLSAFAEVLQAGEAQEPTAQIENTEQAEKDQEPVDEFFGVSTDDEQMTGDDEASLDEGFSQEQETGKDQGILPDEGEPEASADQAEPRAIMSIQAVMANANAPLPGERPTNPTNNSYITINRNTAGLNSQTGASFSDIVAAAEKTEVTGNAYGMKYVYWRAVLLGRDGNTYFGPSTDGDGNQIDGKQPWSGNAYYADSGVTVTKVRYQNNQLQFMPADGEDNAGQWVSISSKNTSDLQLVLYYLQVNPLGEYVNLEYSHWGVNRYTTERGGSPKAVMGQVVDEDTGKVLANGHPMYWYYDHTGVKNVMVTEQNLGDYEIVSAEKYAAVDQDNNSWDGTDDYTEMNVSQYLGNLLGSYSVNDIKSKGMSTDWTKNGDPNHVIFRIKVRKTAQASLVKQLAGNDTDQYKDKEFTFSATVTLSETSNSTLRDTYPIEGAADGSTSVHMVVSADGKSGTVTGIKAKPGQKVTLKGLPYGATVKFTETGIPATDPSVFTTTYANDVTHATDGTAVARHSDGEDEKAPQTVTATNTVNPGSGKLTVTKTFKGLNKLTAQERENLYNAFQITSTENRIPALTLKNATSNTGDILADDVTQDITYTWDMAKLSEGKVTLTEENYTVSGKGVTTESQVATDGAAFKPSVETQVTTDTKTVAFTNEYGTTNTEVKIRKEWAEGITDEEKKPVTVKLTWQSETAKEDGSKYSGIAGEYTFDGADDTDLETAPWAITVKNLPQHTGTYGDITYFIEEIKVGDKTPADAGFTPRYKDSDSTFIVTNSKANGAFELTKKVEGTAANNQQDYTFEISTVGKTLSNQEFTGKKANADFTLSFNKDGVATVTLKDGQTLNVNLPLGDYQVVETGVADGTTVTAKVNGAKVSVDKSNVDENKLFNAKVNTSQDKPNVTVDADGTSVEVTNTTDAKPNLGISSNSLPMAGIGAVAVAGIAALAASQHRRNTPLGGHARKE